ncbi:MAG: Gfo/Idh/MocA family oxidoreductase [Verrucomicrobia bacterium]|nr:Gfo/Idh/MocA family oxidoreductase [Verrucomicrobiota bacterium]MBU1734373.1 Gfo/Idh/MocA family oxidoreductase [Verrucomicrobiota bacterium]MBU1856720.1 Gfo/Idh/MocA family oxidoreductase [Verrucomicrobiota bacterium]
MSKQIGFVDFKLDNFHANTYLAAIRKELSGRGFTVAGCYDQEEVTGRQWAEKNGVPYFDSVAKLDKAVDHYMILAPSNPETHWALCKKVLPMRKTTYVDKTFAPDLKTAAKIFALADKHGVTMQTTSALRYTKIQAHVREVGAANVRHMVAWRAGSSFEEYAIHPVELVVSCMGPAAERLMLRGSGNQRQLIVDFSGGRTAVINVYLNAATPCAASVTTDKETKIIVADGDPIFLNMAAAILDLFETGKATIDRAESLMIRRILDVALKAKATGKFMKL